MVQDPEVMAVMGATELTVDIVDMDLVVISEEVMEDIVVLVETLEDRAVLELHQGEALAEEAGEAV